MASPGGRAALRTSVSAAAAGGEQADVGRSGRLARRTLVADRSVVWRAHGATPPSSAPPSPVCNGSTPARASSAPERRRTAAHGGSLVGHAVGVPSSSADSNDESTLSVGATLSSSLASDDSIFDLPLQLSDYSDETGGKEVWDVREYADALASQHTDSVAPAGTLAAALVSLGPESAPRAPSGASPASAAPSGLAPVARSALVRAVSRHSTPGARAVATHNSRRSSPSPPALLACCWRGGMRPAPTRTPGAPRTPRQAPPRRAVSAVQVPRSAAVPRTRSSQPSVAAAAAAPRSTRASAPRTPGAPRSSVTFRSSPASSRAPVHSSSASTTVSNDAVVNFHPLDANIDLFVRNAVSGDWRKAIERETRLFIDFVRRSEPQLVLDIIGHDRQPDSPAAAVSSLQWWTDARLVNRLLAQLPLDSFLRFLFTHYVERGLVAAPRASALHTARRLAGGSSFISDIKYTRFLAAARKAQPGGANKLDLFPYAPWQLVERLPLDSSFASLRLRALVLLRIVSVARSGEPASIPIVSVREVFDPMSRKIVVFRFCSKNSSRFHIATDSNYVEYLTRPSWWRDSFPDFRLFCPATQVLRLRAASLARARRAGASPQQLARLSLFTNELRPGLSLGVDRVRSIVTDFMRSVETIDSRWTAHSLRQASQQMLFLLEIPPSSIGIRAGWVAADDSATRVSSYTSYRLVPFNFANLLVFPPGSDSNGVRS